MSRAIMTAADLEALPIGSVLTLTTPYGEIANAGLKTEPDNWALAGLVLKWTNEKLFQYAVERDGFTLELL